MRWGLAARKWRDPRPIGASARAQREIAEVVAVMCDEEALDRGAAS